MTAPTADTPTAMSAIEGRATRCALPFIAFTRCDFSDLCQSAAKTVMSWSFASLACFNYVRFTSDSDRCAAVPKST